MNFASSERFSGFKSFQPVFFWCSLQSKETQKVHQRFRPFLPPENKKLGFRTVDQPPESPKLPDFALFLPKMQEKTPFVVVDKRGFLDYEKGLFKNLEFLSSSFFRFYTEKTSLLHFEWVFFEFCRSQTLVQFKISCIRNTNSYF